MVFFAAGQFRIEQGTDSGRPYVYAVSAKLGPTARRRAMRSLRRTDDVLSWLAKRLGEYPFASTGGVVVGVPAAYALEDATRPVYPSSQLSGGGAVPLLVHELSHQWFGDDVALRRWRDVWLNEGFATYAEWWYAEQHGGVTVSQRLDRIYGSTPIDSGFWDVRVSDPGPAQMWNRAVYVRGALTLAALRNRIGDAGLATLLRRWVAEHGEENGDGHGTGEQLRSLAEEVSGEDLDGFFQHWLDDVTKPAATTENGLG